MYSLSSQIMEGVTDFVLKESRQSDTDVEKQKGPQDSGKKMAEIIETTSASMEKKFLHDYAFSIFEEKLIELDKVVSLTADSSFDELVGDERGRRLVRVKAKANFLDAFDVIKTLENLASIQDAFTIVGANDRREEIISQLAEMDGKNAQKGAFVALRNELEHLSKSLVPREKQANDKLYYKSMAAILEHGFKGRLDVRMNLSDCKVCADLKRSCLKDPEDFIFKTYSRASQIELVLLGVATQLRPAGEALDDIDNLPAAESTMGEIIANSTSAMNILENHFYRSQGNQVFIDPIALYLEL
ncbi:hypothetical protein [Pseudomonas congelans]|nr:hypothetical protein [Pseudomonas congelans]